MDRIYQPHKGQINNVALGQPFSTEFPIGPAYRFMDIVVTYTTVGGLIASAVTDFLDLIQFKINGKPFRTFLGKEGDSIHQLFGANYKAQLFKSSGSGDALIPVLSGTALQAPLATTQTTCVYRIYFEEPWRKTWAAASSRKLYTRWPNAKNGASQVLNSFTLEAIIPNTAQNAGATGLTVRILLGTDSSVGPVDAATGNPVTTNLKWYRYPGVTYTAAGDVPLNNLVKYDKGKALAILEQADIFSQSTGDDINHLTLELDGRKVYDASAAANALELVRHGMNPSYNLDEFHYVADANDQITDGLFLSTPNGSYVNNVNMTGTLGAAAGGNKTLVVISQMVGPLD